MTSILEKAVAIIAPHRCLICSNDNNILCDDCILQLGGMAIGGCFLCGAQTVDSATCSACQKQTTIQHVWTAGDYEGVLAEAVKQFKFERASAASLPLAKLVAAQLPQLPTHTIIVPIPTAPTRVRQRGYDQADLLANELGKLLTLPSRSLLGRTNNDRQLGATRAQRQLHASRAFYCKNMARTPEAVLLVDDVVTTGATLDAAAALLQQAGVQTINAATIVRRAAPQ